MRRSTNLTSCICLGLTLLLSPALPACLQAGCVRNSDCASADWCIDTKCVPRPVDGGTDPTSTDGGIDKDGAASSSSAFDAAIENTASTSPDAGKAGDAGDAGNTHDAASQM